MEQGPKVFIEKCAFSNWIKQINNKKKNFKKKEEIYWPAGAEDDVIASLISSQHSIPREVARYIVLLLNDENEIERFELLSLLVDTYRRQNAN